MTNWSPLLLESELVRLAEHMTVELIMTRRDELVCVEVGEDISAAKHKMRGYYDQLPVTRGGEIVGLIRAADIREKAGPDKVEAHFAPIKNLHSLRSRESINDALAQLTATECSLVFDAQSGVFSGLIHFSDLNKQAVRVFLYLWISALEMGLAEFLRRFHPRLKEWLDLIPSANRATFLGDYILKKRQRIELNPVEGLYFSDMLIILRKLPTAPERLGIGKRELELLAKPEPINELRNMAMHPVRLIVRNQTDVKDIAGRLVALRMLHDTISRALGPTMTTNMVTAK